MKLGSDFYTALEIQVFIYHGDDNFEQLNESLSWFQELLESANCLPEKNTSYIHLSQYFPFIENYLIDAKKTWKSKSKISIESGVWTEKVSTDKEIQLEAKAFSADGIRYLIIENISNQFPERQSAYQKMRELALINEKLICELNRRQRSLQKEILKTIEQKKSIEQLKRDYQNHTAAVMICQSDGQVEVTNNALINIYKPKDNTEESYQSLLENWVSEAEEIYPEIKSNIESGRYWEGNFETLTFDGEKKYIQLSIAPVWGDDLKVNHYVCIAYDLSEYQLEEQENNHLEFDYTTKLPNRRYFWHKFEQKIESCSVTDKKFALLLIDLDNFKQLNDEFGHVAGDTVLSNVGSRLSSNLKHVDFVAHLGGDVYAILLDINDKKSNVLEVAERLLKEISKPIIIDDSLLALHCSIGIAEYNETSIQKNDFFKQADLALFYAKQQGKNCIQLYNKKLEKKPESFKVIQELRAAFIQGQFEMYYQPQVPIQGENFRFEALLRWNHPEKGLLLPGSFISQLEDSGLIINLGYWIIEEACKQVKKLQKKKIDTTISINISAKQLNHSNFYSELKKAVNRSGISPQSIEIEITEHCFIGEKPSVVKLLKSIRELGVLIAIDDFGSGYSSLSYLKKLPVDVLKIDHSFVTELPNDGESKAIIISIMQLAEALKLKVVAEGVETIEQYEFLANSSCDYIQGFYFSPAVQASQIPKLLEKLSAIKAQM